MLADSRGLESEKEGHENRASLFIPVAQGSYFVGAVSAVIPTDQLGGEEKGGGSSVSAVSPR